MKKEKTLLILISLNFILLSIFLINASNPFEDLISNFNLGVLGFIISLIPMLILLFITYLSIRKASRLLMTIQLLLWWIFTIYMCLRAFSFLSVTLNLGFIPSDILNFFTTSNVPTNENQHYWYMLSIYANAIIGLIMSFANSIVLKIMLKIVVTVFGRRNYPANYQI